VEAKGVVYLLSLKFKQRVLFKNGNGEKMCNLLSLKSGNMGEWENVGSSEAHVIGGVNEQHAVQPLKGIVLVSYSSKIVF
jgi:hypothetical protein